MYVHVCVCTHVSVLELPSSYSDRVQKAQIVSHSCSQWLSLGLHMAGSVKNELVHQPDLGTSTKSIMTSWENNNFRRKQAPCQEALNEFPTDG